MKIKYLLIIFAVFAVSGCGQRIAGNPSKFNYEEYSDYSGYHKKQVEEQDQKTKQINPQSVIPNSPLAGESSINSNKSCRRRSRE